MCCFPWCCWERPEGIRYSVSERTERGLSAALERVKRLRHGSNDRRVSLQVLSSTQTVQLTRQRRNSGESEATPPAFSWNRASNILTQYKLRGSARPIEDFYVFVSDIGSGSFGTVSRWAVKAGDSQDTPSSKLEHFVAVKQLKWNDIWGGLFRNRDHEAIIRAELEVLLMLDNPFIIKFREWFEHPRKGLFFVMELCNGKSFHNFLEDICTLEKDMRIGDLRYIRKFFRQTVYAVSYLHSLDPPVVHRDLKPDNILLTTADPREKICQVKVIDFGLIRRQEGKGVLQNTMSGTPLFMPPECMFPARYFEPFEWEYTPQMDTWALGIIVGWAITAVEHGSLQHLMLPMEAGQGFDVDPTELPRVFLFKESWKRELLVGWPEDVFYMVDNLLVYPPELKDVGQERQHRATASELLRMDWVAADDLAKASLLQRGGVADNLRSFKQLQAFDRLILSLFAEHASGTRVQQLARTFRALDQTGSGRLSKEELLEGMRLYANGQDTLEEEIQELFEGMFAQDKLDYHEFMSATIGKHVLQQESAIEKAFQYLDFSNTGRISQDDLERAIGEEEAKRICKRSWFSLERSLDRRAFRKVVDEIAEQRALILIDDAAGPEPAAPAAEEAPAAAAGEDHCPGLGLPGIDHLEEASALAAAVHAPSRAASGRLGGAKLSRAASASQRRFQRQVSRMLALEDGEGDAEA